MAVKIEEWDTKTNLANESGATFGKRSIDLSDEMMAEDLGEQDVEGREDSDEDDAMERDGGGFPLDEGQLMSLVRSAYAQGKSYQEILMPRWSSAYSAFNNKHAADSKYSSARFRGRSQIYRPKTRATARKKQAEAAAALFSTSDALIVRASDESNAAQLAGAELISALLRFRLDRSNENAGVPWFQIATGAHLAAMQTGICVSKQSWEYRRQLLGYEDIPVTIPVPPQLQALTGMDAIPTGETVREPIYRIVRDRPRIELLPPEDVIRDPAAAWEDQAQDSAYLILRFPMTVDAAHTFLTNSNDKSAVRFVKLSRDQLAGATSSSDTSGAAGVRRAREQSGTDRMADFSVDKSYSQVWLHENYFRIEKQDYVFWTLGQDKLISEVIPVEEAYPEQGGARPIVIGTGALEPFKIDPMAPVESWQPLQREINDLVNLRLDTVKQTIAPLAKVRRGSTVDVRAIQNRTPDTIVYMKEMSDVEFDRPGSAAGEAFVEMEKLNADFDDQAGNFSTGSVQTNRQLGETVGGMQMMMSSASALGEFDLRVYVETWVEPVLRQIVKLEQYYESDANVIAISAKRAKLMPRFGISDVTDELLNAQVAISVDVGLGSSDPMQSLAKFQQASTIVLNLLGPRAQARMKDDAIIDEVYGKAGYRDASERFYNRADDEDPRIAEMQAAMQEIQGQLQQAVQALQDKKADLETRVEIAKISANAQMAKAEMDKETKLALADRAPAETTDDSGQAERESRKLDIEQYKADTDRMQVEHSIATQERDTVAEDQRQPQATGGDAMTPEKFAMIVAPIIAAALEAARPRRMERTIVRDENNLATKLIEEPADD